MTVEQMIKVAEDIKAELRTIDTEINRIEEKRKDFSEFRERLMISLEGLDKAGFNQDEAVNLVDEPSKEWVTK